MTRLLRASVSAFRIEVASGLQYRAAALSGAAISIFWAVIEVTVITVFYTHADRAAAGTQAGMPLGEAVSYIWLAQVLFMLQGGLHAGLVAKIGSGDVALELCRPMPLYLNWLVRSAAGRVAPFLLRGLPTAAAGLLMPAAIRLGAPASVGGLCAALLLSVGALVFSGSFAVLLLSLQMRVSVGAAPVNTLNLIGMILSGTYLPLQLWPDFMQGFLKWQPFAGLVDIPLRMYVGTMPPKEALLRFSIQMGWTAVFVVLGASLMHRNTKRIEVQGG